MTHYTCSKCESKVLVTGDLVVTTCNCKAGISAHLKATATGESKTKVNSFPECSCGAGVFAHMVSAFDPNQCSPCPCAIEVKRMASGYSL